MVLPESRAGKITVAILGVFTIAMNPPIITIIDTPTMVWGINVLYLWTVVWGILITLVLIWAAWRDAFALTEDQVPPELRGREDVMTTESKNRDATIKGGD
ncbi:hypothetical protein [Haladaptatus sp. NG-WS-4]